jgi:hypothetical protein
MGGAPPLVHELKRDPNGYYVMIRRWSRLAHYDEYK